MKISELVYGLWSHVKNWLFPPIYSILIIGSSNSGKSTFLRSLQLGQLAESEESTDLWKEQCKTTDALFINDSHTSHYRYNRSDGKLYDLDFENLQFKTLNCDLSDSTAVSYSFDYTLQRCNWDAIIVTVDLIYFANRTRAFFKPNPNKADLEYEMRSWRSYFFFILQKVESTVQKRKNEAKFWNPFTRGPITMPPIYFFLNKKDGMAKLHSNYSMKVPSLETLLQFCGFIEGYEFQNDALSNFIRDRLQLPRNQTLTNVEYEQFHELFQLKFYETNTKNGDGIYKALEDILQTIQKN